MAKFHIQKPKEGTSIEEFISTLQTQLDELLEKKETEFGELQTKIKTFEEKEKQNLLKKLDEGDQVKKLQEEIAEIKLNALKAQKQDFTSKLLDDFTTSAKDLILEKIDYSLSNEEIEKQVNSYKENNKDLLKGEPTLPKPTNEGEGDDGLAPWQKLSQL